MERWGISSLPDCLFCLSLPIMFKISTAFLSGFRAVGTRKSFLFIRKDIPLFSFCLSNSALFKMVLFQDLLFPLVFLVLGWSSERYLNTNA